MDCQVCFEPFNQDLHAPKFLIKCGHTICNSCLNNSTIQSFSHSISCPFCKCHYGPLELNNLPTNFAVLNILNTPTKQPSYRDNLTPLSIGKALSYTTKCPLHEKFPLQYICNDCPSSMCSKCLLEHKVAGHDVVMLEDEYCKQKQTLIAKLSEVEGCLQHVREGKEKFLSLLAEYQRLTKRKANEAETKFKEWMVRITAKKDRIIQVYYDSAQELDKELKSQVEFLSGIEDRLKNNLDALKSSRASLGNIPL